MFSFFARGVLGVRGSLGLSLARPDYDIKNILLMNIFLNGPLEKTLGEILSFDFEKNVKYYMELF